MAQKLSSIHNNILKERWRNLEREIKAHAPEIETSKRIEEFLANVNVMSFKDRLRIIWKILRRKM